MSNKAFKYEKDSDGVVTVTIDMEGPVNAINNLFLEELEKTIDRLETEKNLTGVILTSGKTTFIAGGDLNLLLSIEKGQTDEFFEFVTRSKGLTRRFEKLPVPVVSAINGACMGGGYEICLCTNRRILVDDQRIQVGLPEVGIGLLPGGGGIVRLVHLLGLQKALPFLLEGKKLSGEKAVSAGLVHETVATQEELLPRAKAWILENKDNKAAAVQPWDTKGHKIPGGGLKDPMIQQIIAGGVVMISKMTHGNMPAPGQILDVAVEAMRLDFDVALRVETRRLLYLITSPQAKNMVTTLFMQLNELNNGGSRPKGIAKSQVKKVGILGAGMMGQGIAAVSAQAGISVVLKDMSQEAADQGKAYTKSLLDKRVQRGRMNEEKAAEVLGLITATTSDDDLKGCDLIVEAVFENLDLKHKVTKETEPKLVENGIFASNTSTLPITKLAEASQKPENFIGMHFFSPVDKMPLVEIIVGEKTSDETLARSIDYALQIKKVPIVVNDSLSFYTSRTIQSVGEQVVGMLMEGVHPVRIDNLVKSIGMPQGFLSLLDDVGYSILLSAKQTHLKMGYITQEEHDSSRIVQVFTEMNKMGREGRKNGKGFYNYTNGSKSVSSAVVDKWYREDYEISDEDIKDRLLMRPMVESLICLETGVLNSVADANIGSIMGIGAPIWTGGYIQFINTYGLEKFKARTNELADKYGEDFRPPAILQEHIDAGKTFH